MNSIKELKEQLGYEEIGLDDTFTFHCTQCGKCCIHREDILLSPKDLFNIAKKFKTTRKNQTLSAIKKPEMYGTRCQTGSLCHVSDWQISCLACRWCFPGKSGEIVCWIYL